MEPIALLALAGLGLAAMAKGKRKSGGNDFNPPIVDSKGLELISEMRATPNGDARYWKNNMIPSVLAVLKSLDCQAIVEGLYKGSRTLVYRLLPRNSSNPNPDAFTLASAAFNSGSAVLVTASLWDKSDHRIYMAFVAKEHRAEWTSFNRQWCILLDDIAGRSGVRSTTTPSTFTTSSVMFDENLTQEEIDLAIKALSDDNADPATLHELSSLASQNNHPKLASAFRIRAAELEAKLRRQPSQKTAGPSKQPTTFNYKPGNKVPSLTKTPQGNVPGNRGTSSTLPRQPVAIMPNQPKPATQPFIPYLIKSGDTAYGLAQKLTGDGNRWREILPLNPEIKEVQVPISGIVDGDEMVGEGPVATAAAAAAAAASKPKYSTQLRPWNPGQMVKLPISWNKSGVGPIPPPQVQTKQITTNPGPASIDESGTVYTIKSGDTAYGLAQKRTGNGNRWREILPLNPGMKVVQVNGVTQIRPWNVGQTIRLPW